jgi:heterodisulfide reductase subunit A
MNNDPKLKEQIQKLRQISRAEFGDVLVVGGGVSGIQASLDLATAGFRVYLVEKSPAIGGHMAQLDKTFPTRVMDTVARMYNKEWNIKAK